MARQMRIKLFRGNDKQNSNATISYVYDNGQQTEIGNSYLNLYSRFCCLTFDILDSYY